ncbi:acetylcholinesterase-like [Amphiura filiformis]|uniref:acetylcholinesterase-like n=1 Tax=Amphiura filiformis TaxID=82378 RepID=UPI003B2165A0
MVPELLLVPGLLAIVSITYASDPVVKLYNGGLAVTGRRFQFRAKDTDFEVDAYLGIPYAEPPVGPLRFQPPVPMELKGEFNAKEYGKICPQPMMPEVFPFLKAEQVDEDCLILNVHVPVSKPSNAAVMVHIHGGGYMIGAGTMEDFDFYPMSALGEVIIVSFNYRLGTLGFLSTADEVLPGNLGMFDQVEALKWVQKNIAVFGGDPDRVTIFGISAGGSSSSLHTLSPLSKGLFARAIMQSGNAAAPWAQQDDAENIRKGAFSLGKAVGCNDMNEENTKQLVDCLMDATADELVQAYQTVLAGGTFFSPVFDGKFFTERSKDLIQKRSFAVGNMDVLVGHTKDEGMMYIFTLYPGVIEKPHVNATFFDVALSMSGVKLEPIQRAATELVYFDDHVISDPDPDYFDATVKLLSDYGFRCPTDTYLRAASEAGLGSVYAYEFNYHPSKSMFNAPWSGACHGDDETFMGAHFMPNDFILTDVEVDMTLKLIMYWSNFAKTGNPNIGNENEEASTPAAKLLEWPRYTVESRMFKELSPSMRNIPDPSGIACRLWNDYLPKLDAALADKEECKSHWTKEGKESCSEESEP